MDRVNLCFLYLLLISALFNFCYTETNVESNLQENNGGNETILEVIVSPDAGTKLLGPLVSEIEEELNKLTEEEVLDFLKTMIYKAEQNYEVLVNLYANMTAEFNSTEEETTTQGSKLLERIKRTACGSCYKKHGGHGYGGGYGGYTVPVIVPIGYGKGGGCGGGCGYQPPCYSGGCGGGGGYGGGASYSSSSASASSSSGSGSWR